jgi:hypothetical protein
MSRTRLAAPLSLHASAVLLVALVAGCAFDPKTEPPPPPPVLPPADSPQNAIARFVGTYEQLDITEYKPLFTKDFRFTFSSQSDPLLAQQYGSSWGKDDEVESTTHLFLGFVDEHGTYQPAAARIELQLPFVQELEDPAHTDSVGWYRVVSVPRLLLEIVLADERGFSVDAPHDFYLVRGDAAVLAPDQDSSPDRWYVYRWDDRSSALPGAAWLTTRARYR